MRCPYCGSPVVLRSADGIYRENNNDTKLYVCSRYPICDAYVRVQAGTKNIPLGSLANGELRSLRREAHRYFDRIHLSGLMSKQDAYAWLATIIAAPMSHAHIGHLSEYYCKVSLRRVNGLWKTTARESKGGIPGSGHGFHWQWEVNCIRLSNEQQQLVEDNLALVRKVISDRVHGAGSIGIFTYEDLYQIGCVGLCKAACTDKYQYVYNRENAHSEGETRFSTYAYRLIWNEICTMLGYDSYPGRSL